MKPFFGLGFIFNVDFFLLIAFPKHFRLMPSSVRSTVWNPASLEDFHSTQVSAGPVTNAMFRYKKVKYVQIINALIAYFGYYLLLDTFHKWNVPLTINCLNGWSFSGAFFFLTIEIEGICPSFIVMLHLAYERDFPFVASRVKVYLLDIPKLY